MSVDHNVETRVEYDIDIAKRRLVITTHILTFKGLKDVHEASATYITFEDLQHPKKVGEFFTKWGNKWLN